MIRVYSQNKSKFNHKNELTHVNESSTVLYLLTKFEACIYYLL